MNKITEKVGSRIKNYRLLKGLTQERLAELSDLHNTYIGQIERGEKNLCIVSLDKILTALGVSYSEFFEFADIGNKGSSTASLCYDIICNKNEDTQKHILNILKELDYWKKK